MKLLRRILHASHFLLDGKTYCRADTGEWFLELSPGAWSLLTKGDADALESFYEEWNAAQSKPQATYNETDLPF